jgi:hypothetical protein
LSNSISSADVENVLNYADVLYDGGWTAEAYRICQLVAANGIVLDQGRCGKIVEAYARLTPEQDLGPHKPLTVMRDRQVFSSLHLTSHLTAHQKRVAFKSGVGFISRPRRSATAPVPIVRTASTTAVRATRSSTGRSMKRSSTNWRRSTSAAASPWSA